MATTWSNNPQNLKSQYADFVYPSAVFEECYKSCIPENASKYSAAEKLCYRNCEKKHSQAFDLFINIWEIKELHKPLAHLVDIGAYTEMELAHKHDMFNDPRVVHFGLREENTNHKQFNDLVNQEMGGLKS